MTYRERITSLLRRMCGLIRNIPSNIPHGIVSIIISYVFCVQYTNQPTSMSLFAAIGWFCLGLLSLKK